MSQYFQLARCLPYVTFRWQTFKFESVIYAYSPSWRTQRSLPMSRWLVKSTADNDRSTRSIYLKSDVSYGAKKSRRAEEQRRCPTVDVPSSRDNSGGGDDHVHTNKVHTISRSNSLHVRFDIEMENIIEINWGTSYTCSCHKVVPFTSCDVQLMFFVAVCARIAIHCTSHD